MSDSHEQVTIVTIDLEGLVPAGSYVVYVRGGRPAAPSAGFGSLGAIHADHAGQAHLETEALTASAGGDALPLTLDLLADGDHFIEIHAVGTGRWWGSARSRGEHAWWWCGDVAVAQLRR